MVTDIHFLTVKETKRSRTTKICLFAHACLGRVTNFIFAGVCQASTRLNWRRNAKGIESRQQNVDKGRWKKFKRLVSCNIITTSVRYEHQ